MTRSLSFKNLGNSEDLETITATNYVAHGRRFAYWITVEYTTAGNRALLCVDERPGSSSRQIVDLGVFASKGAAETAATAYEARQ